MRAGRQQSREKPEEEAGRYGRPGVRAGMLGDSDLRGSGAEWREAGGGSWEIKSWPGVRDPGGRELGGSRAGQREARGGSWEVKSLLAGSEPGGSRVEWREAQG